MPDLSIWQLFEAESLTSLYRGTIEELRPNPFFDAYTPGTPATFEQDEVRVLTVGQVAEPAPLNAAGQPARVLDLSGAGDAQLTGIRAFNTIPIHGRTLDLMRSFERGSNRAPSTAELSLQREGEGLLAREMRRMAMRHTLTKHQYAAKYLTGGMIYIGGDGKILESSTGARVSITTGIPAENMGAVNPGGADLVPAGSPWTTTSTKNLDQLDAINDYNVENGRLPIRHVWLNTAWRKHIRALEQMKSEFGGTIDASGNSPDYITATRDESIEVGRYVFHFYGETYIAADGTRKPYIPLTKAILTPEPSDGDWLVHGIGRTPIPTELGISASLPEALASFNDVYGDFSYLATLHNVIALHVFVGFAWLFGMSAPENVYVPTIGTPS